LFVSIRLIEPDGGLSKPLDWENLAAKLNEGKGWEDLLAVYDTGDVDG
jgi:hypothetical protein